VDADAERLADLLEAVFTYIDHFVEVEAALIDGFNVGAWCADTEAAIAAYRSEQRADERAGGSGE
jgi:hypothetical protein